jgi:AAA domain
VKEDIVNAALQEFTLARLKRYKADGGYIASAFANYLVTSGQASSLDEAEAAIKAAEQAIAQSTTPVATIETADGSAENAPAGAAGVSTAKIQAMSDDEVLQEFKRQLESSAGDADYEEVLQDEIERRKLTVPEDDEEHEESDTPHDVMGVFERAAQRLSPEEEWKKSPWWLTFKGAGELEDGDGIKMYINNFIPEGVTILASLPKEGKTWLALSICKALTSGQPLFGRAGFEVPEIVPVIYMAAEVSERALKHRIKKFGITDDKSKFLCRTVSSNGQAGNMDLNDSSLLQAISAMKPVIILDVLQCFSDSEDENDAAENKNLRRTIDGLRGRGARAVIVLHHSTKNFKQKPTKENAVRGSGDILAMVDCVWALMLDDRLCQNTNIEEVDVIGWGRDFAPTPFRFALTRRGALVNGNTYRNGVVSVLDTDHDLVFVDKSASKESIRGDVTSGIDQLIEDNPTITVKELIARSGQSRRTIDQALKELGWTKPSGRAKKGEAPRQWTRVSNTKQAA